jgi:hypothetical protein
LVNKILGLKLDDDVIKIEDVPEPDLDVMKSRWDRVLEYARTRLKDGTIGVGLVLIYPMEGNQCICLPMNYSNDDEKYRFFELVKRTIFLMRANNYLILSEAWMSTVSTVSPPTDYREIRPSKDPNKKEVLIIANRTPKSHSQSIYFIDKKRKKGRLKVTLTEHGAKPDEIKGLLGELFPHALLKFAIPDDYKKKAIEVAAKTVGLDIVADIL